MKSNILNIRFSVLIVTLALLVSPISADIYRWQDDDGHWHFSDSPTSDDYVNRLPAAAPDKNDTPSPPSSMPVRESRWTSPTKSVSPSQPASPSVSIPLADATGSQDGLLWRISGVGRHPSYLLGTIHSADPRVARLRTDVAAALDRSDRFVMEMAMDASALLAFGATMMLTDGNDLERLLGLDMYGHVVRLMADYGLPEMVVRMLKPWVVMALLSMPKPSGEPILDLVLYQRAASQGKPTTGLESAREQLAVFDGLSMEDQLSLLKMTIDQLPNLPGMFEQLVQAYVADDLNRIAILADQYKNQGDMEVIKRFMLRLNEERNRRMVHRLQPYLEQGNSFIAIGALHLAGPAGLVQLLRRQGFHLETMR